jgi:hypothetical protein
MYLIFFTQSKANEALDRINANMDLPDGKGTETWAKVEKAHEQEIWYFIAPKSVYLEGVEADEEWSDISDLLPPRKSDEDFWGQLHSQHEE